MQLAPFAAPGRFLRGNLHTHSTLSDGVESPERVAAIYRQMGYDFLCLSDHFMARYGFPVADTRSLRTDGFTTIFGAELHAPENSQREQWHILACGLPLDFAPLSEGEDGVALARRARDAGAFVAIAHPQWSSLTVEDGRALLGAAHAVEIFNTGCALETARPDGTYLLDMLANEGALLHAIACDDAHLRVPDAGQGWVMVKTEANEPDAILDALKNGRFYASCGPVIVDARIEGDEIAIRTSPCRNIAVLGRGSRAANHFGEALEEARLPLHRFRGDWFRVAVTDETGRTAWTGPVALPTN